MRHKNLFRRGGALLRKRMRLSMTHALHAWYDYGVVERKCAAGDLHLVILERDLAALRQEYADNTAWADLLDSELSAVKGQVELMVQDLMLRAQSSMVSAAAAARQQEWVRAKKQMESMEKERQAAREQNEARMKQLLLENQNDQAAGRDMLLKQLREQEASLLQEIRDVRHTCSERMQCMQDDLAAREKAKEAELASTLRGMRESTESCEQERKGVWMNCMISRGQQRWLCAAFELWCNGLAALKKERAGDEKKHMLMGRLGRRLFQRSIHMAFKTWSYNVETLKENRAKAVHRKAVVQRIFVRMLNATQTASFDRWCEHVDEKRSLSAKATMVMARWTHQAEIRKSQRYREYV